MKVLIFGATGMVGQGVLRECLEDSRVTRVITLGRKVTGRKHSKMTEIEHADLWNYASVEAQIADLDACFFCLGISSVGMKEKDYHRITHDITLAAAQTLVRLNPRMSFAYVSGEGTDSTEKGRSMWARVKGKTENALMRLPFGAVYLFRPGIIQPLHGIQSKTPAYRLLYSATAPLLPLLIGLFPKYITTTEALGRAMIHLALHGHAKAIIRNRDIHQIIKSMARA